MLPSPVRRHIGKRFTSWLPYHETSLSVGACEYATAPAGSRPGSTLRDDVGLDFIFGRHREAGQHFNAALRESMYERLSAALGRRKGSSLDLESLQRLSVTDLAAACRQARIPPSSDPRAMAAALHALIRPPDTGPSASSSLSSSSSSASSSTAPAAAGLPGRPSTGWDQPTPLRRAAWLRSALSPRALADTASSSTSPTNDTTTTTTSSTSTSALGAAAVQGLPPTGAEVGTLAAGPYGREGGCDRDAGQADERALREAAEREADALFDEELQRRLHLAAISAATTATATVPISSPAAAAPGPDLGAGDPGRTAGWPPAASAAVGTTHSAVGPVGSVEAAAEALPSRGSSARLWQQPPQAQHPGTQAPLPRQQQHPQQQSAVSHRQPLFPTEARPPPPPPPTPLPPPPPPTTTTTTTTSAASPIPPPPAPAAVVRLPMTELLAASESAAGRAGGDLGTSGGVSYEWAPSPSGLPQPAEVFRAVRRCLVRMGYGTKDPRQLRSVLLLSRTDLQALARDFLGSGSHAPPPHLDLDLDASGLGREQLAIRLLQLMGVHPPPSPDANASTGAGAAITSGSSAGASSSTSSGGDLYRGRRRRPWEMLEGGGGDQLQEGPVGGLVDEAAAALGDPRRRAVLAAARRRRELIARAAQPEEVATWLVKARAQDVVVFYLDDTGPGAGSGPGFGSGFGSRGAGGGAAAAASDRVAHEGGAAAAAAGGAAAPLAASAGGGAAVVVATGLSQRHAYACGEAVRYQIRERLEELVAAEAVAEASTGAPLYGTAVPAAPAVSGVNGGDWLSLEAGPVQVHVLTPQARGYYRLEEIFASGGRGRAPRVQLFGPVAGERRADTVETARVDAGAGAQGS